MEFGECPACGGKQMKQGKLMGIAAVQSLDARTPLSGSELVITFCAGCGEVTGLKVRNPEKIK